MPRGGRTKVENPATARRILAAAEEHFAAEGMAGARTEEIASAAHANKAMLYYYFGNKRRLHRAVLENLLRQLRGKSIRSDATRSSRRGTTAGTSCGDISIFWPRIRIIRAWCSAQAMESSRNFGWIVRAVFPALSSMQLVRTIEEGIAAGEFRPSIPIIPR